MIRFPNVHTKTNLVSFIPMVSCRMLQIMVSFRHGDSHGRDGHIFGVGWSALRLTWKAFIKSNRTGLPEVGYVQRRVEDSIMLPPYESTPVYRGPVFGPCKSGLVNHKTQGYPPY